MSEKDIQKHHNILKILGRIFMLLFWGALIALCFIYREQITVEGIVNLVPKNSVVSILVMLLLFAVKGIAVFIYGSILYAASGILFSLPVAIIVNTVGTVIMTSIPFFIGKSAGGKMIDGLLKKNKRSWSFCGIHRIKMSFSLASFSAWSGSCPQTLWQCILEPAE